MMGDAERPALPQWTRRDIAAWSMRLLPAAILFTVAGFMIWGDGGWMTYRDLQHRAEQHKAAWAEVERENQLLMHHLWSLDADPINLERLAAEELGWVAEGGTLYRFEDDS